jgi:hypothetical protein
MSLCTDLMAAGIPIDSHESDLYCLATPEARALIGRAGHYSVTRFRSTIDGRDWYEIPFAFEPWWQARARAEHVDLTADTLAGGWAGVQS